MDESFIKDYIKEDLVEEQTLADLLKKKGYIWALNRYQNLGLKLPYDVPKDIVEFILETYENKEPMYSYYHGFLECNPSEEEYINNYKKQSSPSKEDIEMVQNEYRKSIQISTWINKLEKSNLLFSDLAKQTLEKNIFYQELFVHHEEALPFLEEYLHRKPNDLYPELNHLFSAFVHGKERSILLSLASDTGYVFLEEMKPSPMDKIIRHEIGHIFFPKEVIDQYCAIKKKKTKKEIHTDSIIDSLCYNFLMFHGGPTKLSNVYKLYKRMERGDNNLLSLSEKQFTNKAIKRMATSTFYYIGKAKDGYYLSERVFLDSDEECDKPEWYSQFPEYIEENYDEKNDSYLPPIQYVKDFIKTGCMYRIKPYPELRKILTSAHGVDTSINMQTKLMFALADNRDPDIQTKEDIKKEADTDLANIFLSFMDGSEVKEVTDEFIGPFMFVTKDIVKKYKALLKECYQVTPIREYRGKSRRMIKEEKEKKQIIKVRNIRTLQPKENP